MTTMRSASPRRGQAMRHRDEVCRPRRPFEGGDDRRLPSPGRGPRSPRRARSTAGRRTRARASAMRWRCPPERRAPPSPAGGLVALGQAWRRSRGSRPPAPPPRPPRRWPPDGPAGCSPPIDASKRTLSWKTAPTWPASEARVASATSWPSKRTAPRRGVVEAQQQGEQRALPGAALAHDGHRLPRRQREIDVLQDRLAAREREVHGLEADRAAQRRQRRPLPAAPRPPAAGRAAPGRDAVRPPRAGTAPPRSTSCWTAEIMNHSSSKTAMTEPTVSAPRERQVGGGAHGEGEQRVAARGHGRGQQLR